MQSRLQADHLIPQSLQTVIRTTWKLALHTDAHRSFLPKCPKPEATKTCPSIGKCRNKHWCIHSVEFYSAIKRDEVSSHNKSWRNLRYTAPSEKIQSKKAPTVWLQRHDTLEWQTAKTISRSTVAMGCRREQGAWVGGAEGIFRAERLFCPIPSRWARGFTHVSKPLEHTTRSLDPGVNHGLSRITPCQYWFIGCDQRATQTQDVGNRGNAAEGGYTGIPTLLSFAVDLRLL